MTPPSVMGKRAWENGYLDMKTMRQEFMDYGLQVSQAIEDRVKAGASIDDALAEVRKELER